MKPYEGSWTQILMRGGALASGTWSVLRIEFDGAPFWPTWFKSLLAWLGLALLLLLFTVAQEAIQRRKIKEPSK